MNYYPHSVVRIWPDEGEERFKWSVDRRGIPRVYRMRLRWIDGFWVKVVGCWP